MFKKKAALGVAISALLAAAMLSPNAGAAASLGLSTNCDADGHCVEGSATSSNVGVTVTVIKPTLPPDAPDTDVALDINEPGAAVAVCRGSGPGATLLQIKCSINGNSRQMTFPGSAGAVPLYTTTGALDRWPVCWNVVGYFPTVAGPQHTVPTGGCAQLAV